MSRKNKSGNRRGNGKNYRPMSDSFCNSIVNSNKKSNNLVEDPNNKYVLIYNSDKTAHISREYDIGGNTLLGFKVETKDISYSIDINKNIFDIVVEMLNFGFTYAQIKGLLNITHKQYETYKPKDFNSMNDFIFILSLVPKSLYRCNDVLHYVKGIPDMIVDNPSIEEFSLAANITKNQAKKCLDMYKNGRYANLIGEAKKRKAEQKKAEEKVQQQEQETEIVESYVSVEEPIVEANIQIVDSPEEVVSTDSISEVEISQEVVEVVETVEVEETAEVEANENITEIEDVENSVEIIDEVTEIVPEEGKKVVKSEVGFSMDDYQTVLGFAGIPFDFDFFSKEIKDNLTKGSFMQYIQDSNKEGIANLLYPIVHLNKAYGYSREFTLAEDRILETFYKDIGRLVVKVMETVIPNYQVRPDYEYVYRIRERGVKGPHPIMCFNLLEEDANLIKTLYPKVKKAPTKYFFWLDSFDLFYYVSDLGVGENTSKKVKKVVDLETIDIQSYIDSALKLKEIIYYSDFWTTEKHELFKEEFKINGIKVMEKIPNLTEEECLEHAKQYKILQNYTVSEIERMKEIYIAGGIEAVVQAFPYRTETALKYKIEEEGWEIERSSILMEKEIERRVAERVKKETAQIKKDIIENEVVSLKESLRTEITPVLRSEIVDELYGVIRGSVFHGMKLEMPNLVRKSSLKDLPSVLPQKIVTKLESLVRDEVSKLK